MKTKPSKFNMTQFLRHLIQAAAFIFFPGLFLSIFTSLRDVVTALIGGTFTLTGLAGQLVLLAVVFLLTALWGRIFCGYLCSFGAMQELIGWVSKKLIPRLLRVPAGADRILKSVKYAVLALIVVFVWILQLPVDSSLSPWGVFGMLVSGNLSVMAAAVPTAGFALLAMILIGSFFAERFFCRYLCPLGALLSLASSHRLFRIRKSESACTNCTLCSRSCAMSVDICESPSVSSVECINCMRCVSACPRAALKTAPQPAVAGTAAALIMCGLIHTGDLAVNAAAAEPAVISSQEYVPSVSNDVPDTQAAQPAQAETSQTSQAETAQPAQPSETTAVQGPYADGVYTGSGKGLRGTTEVQVTVESGSITNVTVLSYADDRQYFTRAQSSMIAGILKAQSVDVSTVSGATFSSNSILEAVADALGLDFTNPNSSSGSKKSRH